MKIPTLSSVTNTDIYMYYGNAGASNQQNTASVWDSNYKMVQHLKETAGGAGAIKDSTANSNNGTDYNAPTFGATGEINGAIAFDGTNDFIDNGDINEVDSASMLTLEAWAEPLTGVGAPIISKFTDATHRTHIWVQGTTMYWNISNSVSSYATSPVTLDTWHHFVMVFDGSQVGNANRLKAYVDGEPQALTFFDTIPATTANHAENLTLGKQDVSFFKGTIDEARISNSARSADWIKTSYNNQSIPASFFSLGPEQNVPVSPTVTTNAATAEQETTATLNGVLNNDGGEACQYSFEWGTAPGVYTANISWTGSITTGQTFSTNLIGLTKGQPYYYRAKVINSAGVVNGGEIHFLTKPDGPVVLNAAANGVSQIDLTWTKGAGADRTMVRGKLGSYPTSYTDGYQVYFNTGTSASDTGLSANTTYFYRAWSEVTGSQQWSNTFVSANATTNASLTVIGGKVFTVNKAMILAPWLLLAAGFSIVIFRVAQYLRKKALSRRTREKNL